MYVYRYDCNLSFVFLDDIQHGGKCNLHLSESVIDSYTKKICEYRYCRFAKGINLFEWRGRKVSVTCGK